jgi:hypothetical protein
MSQINANKAGWSIFDEIYYKGVMSGQPAYDNRKSLEWFREYIKNNVRTANAFKAVSDRLEPKITIGQMYIFKYYAKYADELDYWDAVPLIFPFADEGETFLGINLHYAPPKARIVIMKALYTLISDTKMDQKTKLRLTYKKLQRMSSFPYFKPLVKRYRKDHVRSLFVKVEVRYWPVAIFLPIAKWQKQNANTVYRDFNTGTRAARNTQVKKLRKVGKAKI